MLDNTFDEEYYRLENIINTNKTSFYVDREGKLLLTHPFFKESQITEVLPRDTGVNILPDNVNLIIDNIDLFSTNPNCQNYLPLRIPFGTGKPNVEFGDINFTQLENFKVIVNPLIPIDTFRSHRYSSSQDFLIVGSPNNVPTSHKNILNCGTFSNYATKGKDKNFKIEMVSRNDNSIVLYVQDLSSRETVMLTLSDFLNATRFINIYTRDNLCLVVCEDVSSGMTIYDITLSPAGGPPLFSPDVNFNDWRLVKLITITQDNEFVVTHSLPNGGNIETTVDIYIKRSITNTATITWELGSSISVDSFLNTYTLFCAGTVFTNRLLYIMRSPAPIVTYRFIDILIKTSQITPVFEILFDVDITSIISETLPLNPLDNGFLNVNSYLYIGGESIVQPNICIFYWDNTNGKLYFVNLPDYSSIQTIPIKFFKYIYNPTILINDGLKFFNIKRYFNQTYIYTSLGNNSYIFAWNLDFIYDSDIKFIYSFDDLSPLTKISRKTVDCINFAKDSFLVSGRTINNNSLSVENNNIISTYYINQRSSQLATVYKMSYNFVERTYPYTIQGNNITFRINLPNKTPIADLELFKYAMDIRVRYTKTKASINPPTAVPEAPAEAINVGLDLGTLVQCEEDCELNEYEKRNCQLECERPKEQPKEQECKTDENGKVICQPKSSKNRTPNCLEKCGRDKCMTRCNRAVGGVGRVLGLVGEDFSVVDFLNLYTRN